MVQFKPGTSASVVIMPIVNCSMDLGPGVIFIIFTEYIRCVRIVQYSDGLQAGWPGFNSQQGKAFSLLHSI
jgi:hypothetical protein